MEIFRILSLVIAVVNSQFATNFDLGIEENQPRIQKRIFPLERILNKGLNQWSSMQWGVVYGVVVFERNYP